MKGLNDVFVVLHNVHSLQRVIELAKITYGLGYSSFIVSKAVGTAAQVGVPEAQKIAFKCGGRLVFVADLTDAVDLLHPDVIYLFAPKPYGRVPYDSGDVLDHLADGSSVMLVFGGLEPGLSSKDLSMGFSTYLDVPGDIGSIGSASIVLYQLRKAFDAAVLRR